MDSESHACMYVCTCFIHHKALKCPPNALKCPLGSKTLPLPCRQAFLYTFLHTRKNTCTRPCTCLIHHNALKVPSRHSLIVQPPARKTRAHNHSKLLQLLNLRSVEHLCSAIHVTIVTQRRGNFTNIAGNRVQTHHLVPGEGLLQAPGDHICGFVRCCAYQYVFCAPRETHGLNYILDYGDRFPGSGRPEEHVWSVE